MTRKKSTITVKIENQENEKVLIEIEAIFVHLAVRLEIMILVGLEASLEGQFQSIEIIKIDKIDIVKRVQTEEIGVN